MSALADAADAAGGSGPAAPGGRPIRIAAAPPVRSVVPVLALREGRRLLLHPFTLLGFAIYVVATVATVVADEGPGIPDVDQALRDGYTSGGGMGMGLPGTRRLMDEMAVESAVGRGTTVTIRKWRR